MNRLRSFIEDEMDEQWNWWPMSPRLHPLRGDRGRLQWKSADGSPRHIDVQMEKVEALHAALSLAPVFLRSAFSPNAAQRPSSRDAQASLAHTMARKSSYLYLGIQLQNHHVREIDCSTLRDDLDLFRAIHSTYDETRGHLRRWFSIW